MCATGYGIRRSKDLRAEIGKFPHSTNERKNMSTKTNFKRVALVAVTALGLGVLTSVAPANATDVAFGTAGGMKVTKAATQCNIADATTGYTLLAQDTVTSSEVTATTTIKYVTSNAPSLVVGDVVTVDFSVSTANDSGSSKIVSAVDVTSPGYSFSVTTSGKTVAASVDGTATITLVEASTRENGLVVTIPQNGSTVSVTSTNGEYISVGGTAGFNLASSDSGVTLATNGSYRGASDGGTDIVTLGTVGTITVNNYGSATDYVTPLSSITINVVASCGPTNTYSKADSFVSTGTSLTAATSNVDSALTASAGSSLYINIVANSASGSPVVAGTWTASATNNARVKLGTSAVASANVLYSFDSLTSTTGAQITARVKAPVTGTAGNSVVTVSYNGVVVATKSLTWLGEGTKINLVGNYTGDSTSGGLFLLTVTDAAGNQVPASGITYDSLTTSARTTSVTEVNEPTPLAPAAANATYGLPAHTYGVYSFTCSAAAGTGSTTVTMKYLQPVSLAYITLPVELKCAGGVNTYSISMDKASYKIGEIATMSISAKDTTGAAVSDFTTVGTGANVSAGGMSQVGSLATTDTFTGGVKTYKFQVTTAGTFNAVAAISGLTTKSATAAYTVTGGDVALADVLKAIVSLIASINKQIAALQKALLKK